MTTDDQPEPRPEDPSGNTTLEVQDIDVSVGEELEDDA